MTDSVYWIWFQLVFGIGTRRAELLMDYFEDPRELYDGAVAGNRVAGMLDEKEVSAVAPSIELAKGIQYRTLKKGCEILTPSHPLYPRLLRGIYSRPAALYVKGDLSCLDGTLAIAMVGARKYTEYGKQAAAALAEGLAHSGAVVVSGLAAGIDTESHLAALAAGGKTVGVLGCGIDVDYPAGNRELKRAVCENGAVVTEFPLGTEPYQSNFPLRNRIISGMCQGTLVVEADARSGSLITARTALEQGRDIFAVPGSIFVRGEQGTHTLIKKGARLVDTVDDILDHYPHLVVRKLAVEQPVVVKPKRKKPPVADNAPENMRPLAPKATPPQKKSLPEELGEDAARVYIQFGQDTLTVDDLVGVSGLAAGELLSALTELEIYGLIQSYPGRRFGLI